MHNSTQTHNIHFMLAAVAVCVLTAATIFTSCGGGGGGGGASGPANSAPLTNTSTGGTNPKAAPLSEAPYPPPLSNYQISHLLNAIG